MINIYRTGTPNFYQNVYLNVELCRVATGRSPVLL